MLTLDQDYINSQSDPQTSRCMALWASVFYQGLVDAAEAFKMKHTTQNSSALRWLYSDEDNHPGSIVWLCDLFGMDAHRVRSTWRVKVRELISMNKRKERVDKKSRHKKMV